MSHRQVLMRWLMVVVLLSVWPGGIAAAAHPNASGSGPELPHPIIPCTPAELPDEAVPIEDCSDPDQVTVPDPTTTTTTTMPDSTTTTTMPDSTTTTTMPDSTTTTTVPDPDDTDEGPDPVTGSEGQTTTTTVPMEAPIPDQPQDQTQLQPAQPGGSDAGMITCVSPGLPDEAVPDTCPPSDPEDPEEPISSDGPEGSPDPSAEPGPQDPPPGAVIDPSTGSGEGGAGEDSGDPSEQVPAADDSGSGSPTPPSDPPAPDSATPADPATPASPSPGGLATPAEPATPPEPLEPIGVPTEADSPSSPSASVQSEEPAASQGLVDVVEVERVGELVALLQPDALPDLAGFGTLEGATGSTAGKRPPEPTLAAGLDLVLPPLLQSSRGSFQPAVALVTQAVQQLVRSLALPLAAAGLLAMGLIQAGGLSAKKSRLRR